MEVEQHQCIFAQSWIVLLQGNVTWAETLYARNRETLNSSQEAPITDEIYQTFAGPSERLLAILPETMCKLEAYIRANPTEFLLEKGPTEPA